jgi:hypothetical protein
MPMSLSNEMELEEECIIPNPLLKLITISTVGVYIILLSAWAINILLPEQTVILLILYSVFAGLLAVRNLSILKKPAKVLALGVVYAGITTLLHMKVF